MENITIIIPLYEYNDEVKNLLTNAIDSVNKNGVSNKNILLVSSQEVLNKIDSFENVTKVINENPTNYQTQINVAVENVTTEYFSILAYDDEYADNWSLNVNKYLNDDSLDINLFLTFVGLYKDNNYIGLVNEMAWAMAFVQENELGYINEEMLKLYYDFSPNGAVFRKDDYQSIGGLKPSIKLSFWYEFLLRFVSNGKKIFVIPKICYLQKIAREGSYMDIINKTMDEKERMWWIELAKKEMFFKKDRNKQYKEE